MCPVGRPIIYLFKLFKTRKVEISRTELIRIDLNHAVRLSARLSFEFFNNVEMEAWRKPFVELVHLGLFR